MYVHVYWWVWFIFLIGELCFFSFANLLHCITCVCKFDHFDCHGQFLISSFQRGHYLMVRAPTEKEYGQWKIALESQTADNSKATYVRPVLKSVPHQSKVSEKNVCA